MTDYTALPEREAATDRRSWRTIAEGLAGQASILLGKHPELKDDECAVALALLTEDYVRKAAASGPPRPLKTRMPEGVPLIVRAPAPYIWTYRRSGRDGAHLVNYSSPHQTLCGKRVMGSGATFTSEVGGYSRQPCEACLTRAEGLP